MARRHFKPDYSFFNKIVIGAVGTEAVRSDLSSYGFEMIELERGATDAKIWKEVKRKRVRIPDLVCVQTGLRVESRAKTKPILQMSHSPDEAERAWDFGMIDDDWVAFPVCSPVAESTWARTEYERDVSYFHQRVATQWEQVGAINYVPVAEFRKVRHSRGSRKGVVEASEFSIEWRGSFSTRTGPVRGVKEKKVTIENQEGRAYTWNVPSELDVLVREGEQVQQYQLFAAGVSPIRPESQKMPILTSEAVRSRFLESKERTMRFTGAKLARARRERQHEAILRNMSSDPEEDLYVRLEALTYLAAMAEESVADLFQSYLTDAEDEVALEAVISIGEVGNDDALNVLGEILTDQGQPFFLRSAAAWALGRSRAERASEVLVRAFADQSLDIREESLRGLVSLGRFARPMLMAGLDSHNLDVAAGCAEALRQQSELTSSEITEILQTLQSDDPGHWGVWLIGSLPPEAVAPVIQAADDLSDEVHYALSVLWSFGRSWISQYWDKDSLPSQWRSRLSQDSS